MSPHRNFHDDNGLVWQAWDVLPTWGERRTNQRRKLLGGPPPGLSERRISERRRHRGIRIGLSEKLVHGWLSFECNGMRRRLVPIPQDWDALPDEALRDLWRQAEQIPTRKGRLIE